MYCVHHTYCSSSNSNCYCKIFVCGYQRSRLFSTTPPCILQLYLPSTAHPNPTYTKHARWHSYPILTHTPTPTPLSHVYCLCHVSWMSACSGTAIVCSQASDCCWQERPLVMWKEKFWLEWCCLSVAWYSATKMTTAEKNKSSVL